MIVEFYYKNKRENDGEIRKLEMAVGGREKREKERECVCVGGRAGLPGRGVEEERDALLKKREGRKAEMTRCLSSLVSGNGCGGLAGWAGALRSLACVAVIKRRHHDRF